MTEQEQPAMVTLRLASYILDEAQRLVPAVASDKESPLAAGGKVTRADVLRLALVEGLKVVAEHYDGTA